MKQIVAAAGILLALGVSDAFGQHGGGFQGGGGHGTSSYRSPRPGDPDGPARLRALREATQKLAEAEGSRGKLRSALFYQAAAKYRSIPADWKSLHRSDARKANRAEKIGDAFKICEEAYRALASGNPRLGQHLLLDAKQAFTDLGRTADADECDKRAARVLAEMFDRADDELKRNVN